MEGSEYEARGIGVTGVIAVGRAVVLRDKDPAAFFPLLAAEPEEEEWRLKEAIAETRRQLENIVGKAGGPGAEIMKSHLELLGDPVFCEDASEQIRKTRSSVETVIARVTETLASRFFRMEDAYLRERATDVRDVGKRILRNLVGAADSDLSGFPEDSILFARELLPSETAQIDRNAVAGFVTETGGRTGHTAIMARALQIAAVVGCGGILSRVCDGDAVVVDAAAGKVILRPDPETLAHYAARRKESLAAKRAADEAAHAQLRRGDGRPILVAANVGSVRDAEEARKNGADAVGLFRTEFLFMGHEKMPTEEEQFEVYRRVAEIFGDDPVVIRTLDIGGDKSVPYLEMPKENNPFLGMRAIRLCLANPELFRIQLRSLLRASAFGNLQVMFPMIGSFVELRRAREMLQRCRGELESASVAFNRNLRVGMMVEVPAAAVLAEKFAREVDFFSIGTNDLTQYTLAADRENDRLKDLFDFMHPAVLALIRRTADVAQKCGIPCSICGEMASDAGVIPLLTEYGLDEFSVNVGSIGATKSVLLLQKGIHRV